MVFIKGGVNVNVKGYIGRIFFYIVVCINYLNWFKVRYIIVNVEFNVFIIDLGILFRKSRVFDMYK